jgi:hypothetical protein
MKYKELHPEYIGMPHNEVLIRIPSYIIFNCLEDIVEYYNKKLSLVQILNRYTGSNIISGDNEVQVNCILSTHGNQDKNKSPRYYRINRETGLVEERVYCFKCLTTLTSFWFLYHHHKTLKTFNTFAKLFIIINRVFRVPFLFEYILEFNPDEYYSSFDKGSKRSGNQKELYNYANLCLTPKLEENISEFKILAKEFLYD